MDDDQKYLNQVIFPYYQGYLKKDLLVAVVNAAGKYIIATDKLAQAYGYANAADMGNIGPEEIKGGLTKGHLDLFYARLKLAQDIKRPFVFLGNWRHTFYHTTFTPLFFPDGRFLGIEFISEPIDISWYMDMFVGFHGLKQAVNDLDELDQDILQTMSEIQEQILFLAITGKSQYEIGAILGRSRNTIKDVVDSLYKKFNAQDLKNLLIKAVALNFHRQIPLSLLKDNSVLIHVNSNDIVDLIKTRR